MDGRSAGAPATAGVDGPVRPVSEDVAGGRPWRPDRAPRQWWPVLLGLGLALMLLGAAAGLLVGRSGAGDAVPGADSVDVGFAQDMSVHHEQAVEMAAWERDHTADSRLKQLAFDIESTQNAQVGRMQGWLESWDAAALPSGGYMGWMSGSAAHTHGTAVAGTPGKLVQMPGMASAEELTRMRASTGHELDVLFLQLMLRHHEGGVEMARYAAEHAEQGDVRNLARQILTSQSAESDYLRQLLAERAAAPLPG